jgi:hypothetical protein
MLVAAIFGSIVAIIILALGYLLLDPHRAEKLSVFEHTTNEASSATKNTLDEIANTNASSLKDTIIEKKNELIGNTSNLIR